MEEEKAENKEEEEITKDARNKKSYLWIILVIIVIVIGTFFVLREGSLTGKVITGNAILEEKSEKADGNFFEKIIAWLKNLF